MNRYLANYLFSNETIFVLSHDNPEAVGQDFRQNIEVLPLNSIESQIQKETIGISNQKEIILPNKVMHPLKDVVVVVNSINSDQKVLLLKILSSVKLSFESISLIDVSSNTINIPESIKKSNNQILRIICFGVAISKLNLDISLFPYQLKAEKNLNLLLIDSLDTINENQKDEKRLLWVVLKQMFGL